MVKIKPTSQLNHGERLPSSSRYLTVNENITATMDFEVPPLNKDMAVGECVSSRSFKVGGYLWNVDFYPNGQELLYASLVPSDYASAYVRCRGRGDTVRAKFKLSIVSSMADTAEQMPLTRSILHCIKQGGALMSMLGTGQNLLQSEYADEPVFSPGRYEWGYPLFLDNLELEQMSSSGDGRFTIRCVLTVFGEESLPLELPDHLERALKDGGGTDVTFDVGGVLFSAHSVVLAERSPVLDAQLFGPMKEKDMRHVEVVHMEPAIFEMLLHFIYTDSLPTCRGAMDDHDDTAVMQHLLVAADRYGMDRLKLICERTLCNMVNMKTVDSTLALANQHSCKRLKDKCIDILSSAGVPGIVRATNRLAYSDGGSWPGQEQQAVPLPETSYSRSFIATENITATLNFDLGNYQLLMDMAIGMYVSSRIFRVAGYDWTIRFYPQGQRTGAGVHASAFLHCSGARRCREQVRAKFALSMLLQNARRVKLATFDAIERDFSRVHGWGYPEFVKKSELNRPSIFGDLCFTIRCVLTVLEEEPLPLELPDHLARALGGGRGADVTFVVGGMELISAHRFVLAARSPVFAAELPSTKVHAQRVEVDGVEPAIFKMVIHFIYTDTVPPCNDDEDAGHGDVAMRHLIVAADRYRLRKLKMMCEKRLFMSGNLTTVDVMALSWRWKVSAAPSDLSSCRCLGHLQRAKEAMPSLFSGLWTDAYRRCRDKKN